MDSEFRGPRLGDSASLWNFTPSPGFTKTEVAILRLCLMRYGVGRWVQILERGLLQGKLIQQLNGQTQRLLGQQSLAAYTGLKVDVDRIRVDNEARSDVERKAGLIIWSGPNPTKEMKTQWQADAQANYGLSEQQIEAAEGQLQEVEATLRRGRQTAEPQQAADPEVPPDSLIATDASKLSREEKIALLHRLRVAMQGLHARLLLQPEPSPRPQAVELAAAARAGGGARPLQDVSNGNSRQGGGAAPAKGPAAGGRGAKRSRGGGVKPAAAALKREARQQRGKGKGRGRRGWEEAADEPDVHEAPMNEAAEEARDAAYACDVARLQTMGFPAEKAREALDESHFDPDAAIEWLLANCV